MISKGISRGFIAAGAWNIFGFCVGVMVPYISELYPVVFSQFGLTVVLLLGLIYISVANTYPHVRWTIFVFALIKLLYVISWVYWISRHGSELAHIFKNSFLSWLFYASYGAGDAAFGLFFLWVFFRIKTARS